MIYMYFLQENYSFEIKRCGIQFTFKELIFSCKMFIFKDIFLINYMKVRHIESKNNLCSYSFSAIYVIKHISILLYCNWKGCKITPEHNVAIRHFSIILKFKCNGIEIQKALLHTSLSQILTWPPIFWFNSLNY